MKKDSFPALITSLPEADIPFPGVQGWISQASDHQVVFMDIQPIGEVAPHSHGEQWGMVIDGQMELTIGSETNTYKSGDSYHIPSGVVHSANFLTRCLVMDFFADKNRYFPKKDD